MREKKTVKRNPVFGSLVENHCPLVSHETMDNLTIKIKLCFIFLLLTSNLGDLKYVKFFLMFVKLPHGCIKYSINAVLDHFGAVLRS